MSIRLDISVMGWGDPVGLGVHSFTQWDLEVGIHSVADIPVWSPLVGLGIPFDG